MKKTLVLLSTLALVAGCAFAADTYTGSLVDKYTSGVVQKEANIRKTVSDKQKAQEAKVNQLDKKLQAKQDELNKKAQAKQAEQEAKKKALDNKVKAKKDAWNTLMSK